MNDPYKTLNVARNADAETIKSAYRRLAQKHHPDVNPSADAQAKMGEINEAYEILIDAEKRAEYDSTPAGGNKARSGTVQQGPVRPPNMEDLNSAFERFFGYNAKSGSPLNHEQGERKNPIDTTSIFEAFMKGKK